MTESAFFKVRQLSEIQAVSDTDRMGLDPDATEKIAPELVRSVNGTKTVDTEAVLSLVLQAVSEISAAIAVPRPVKEREYDAG